MIYENIQAECKNKGLTIIGLEEMLGFSRGSICKWNTNTPSVAKVLAVAKVLDTTVEKLMNDAEE